MKKRRFMLAVWLAALLCAPIFGCGREAMLPPPTPKPTPAPTAAPTPTPAPTPEPVIAVFGADDAPSFCEGVSGAAARYGTRVTFLPGGLAALKDFEPGGMAAAVLFLAEPADELPQVDFPLYVYAALGQSVPGGIACLTYDDTGAAAEALARAIAYPPHETPVRMLALLTSADSEAHALWQEAVKGGRIYSRGVYVASKTDRTAEAWISAQLDGLYPGMLDAIYAETGEMAVDVLQVLLLRGRSDVEVFAASSGGGIDRVASALLPVVVGADLHNAGGLCYQRARALLLGRAAASSSMAPAALVPGERP